MQNQALVEEVWDGQDDVISSIAAVFDGASQTLEASKNVEACPIAVIALEVASTNDQLRTATAEVFEASIIPASQRLISADIATDDARRLALSIICLIEGAFVLSQAMKSTEPMRSARTRHCGQSVTYSRRRREAAAWVLGPSSGRSSCLDQVCRPQRTGGCLFH